MESPLHIDNKEEIGFQPISPQLAKRVMDVLMPLSPSDREELLGQFEIAARAYAERRRQVARRGGPRRII